MTAVQAFQLGDAPTPICIAQSPLRRTYGCDMLDNNCNGEVSGMRVC